MRLTRLLVLAAGAAYAYRRFFTDSDAGIAETQGAEPFSSDKLDDRAAASADPPPAEPPPAEGEKDTLERPTWLDPADAG